MRRLGLAFSMALCVGLVPFMLHREPMMAVAAALLITGLVFIIRRLASAP